MRLASNKILPLPHIEAPLRSWLAYWLGSIFEALWGLRRLRYGKTEWL